MFSSCPFCHISLPFPELEWHANNHFVEDELARDMELARQIALASPSSRLTGDLVVRCRWREVRKWWARLPESIQAMVAKTGFACFLSVPSLEENRQVFKCLLEHFQPETNSFCFPGAELVVMPLAFHVISVLPTSGEPFRLDDFAQIDLGPSEFFGLAGDFEKGINLAWLKNNFSVPCGAEVEVERRIFYVQAFLTYFLGAVVFPNSSGKTVSLRYMNMLRDIPSLSALDWSGAAYSYVISSACAWRLRQRKAICGLWPVLEDKQMDYVESSDVFPEKTAVTSASSFNHMSADYREIFDQEKISLVGLQTKSTFYKVEGGLMALLRRCLESECENSRSVISGHIDHYQSIVSEDSGWGCGWRNIQMLSSHLLMQRREARDVMFGGSGFVPDIPSLQRWLEIAWEGGFDIPGSDSFKQKIYGSRKWIGTTECAALFRSFGLRARIVDFDSISSSSPATSYTTGEQARQLINGKSRGKRITEQAYGPMDKFLHQRKYDDFQFCPSSNENSWQAHRDLASRLKHSSTKLDHDSLNKYKGKINGHQVLVDWVWNYFTSEVCGRLDNIQHVLISEKTPLYFQHDGHSRTIVGIQMRKGLRGSQNQYTLLVLDPAQRTADLEKSLTNNYGWQKLIKRGVHTLRKPQYQLCYVDPGIACGEEMEQLKTINSVYVKL